MNHEGIVNADGNAMLTVRVRGLRGSTHDIAATVDTGFGGAMVLATEEIERLGLEFRGLTFVALADGTERTAKKFTGEVEWFAKWRRHTVVSLEGSPLLGMTLLRGRRLEIDVVEDGVVRVGAISTQV